MERYGDIWRRDGESWRNRATWGGGCLCGEASRVSSGAGVGGVGGARHVRRALVTAQRTGDLRVVTAQRTGDLRVVTAQRIEAGPVQLEQLRKLHRHRRERPPGAQEEAQLAEHLPLHHTHPQRESETVGQADRPLHHTQPQREGDSQAGR